MTKSRVARPEQVKFLGFEIRKGQDFLYKARPHKLSVKKLKEKVRRITMRRWSINMTTRLARLRYLFRGWFNYFKHNKMKRLVSEIDSYTRVRLSMCIWKQWKTVKNRQKALMKLGIPKRKAWEWANTRKGYARTANSFIMTRSVTNKILVKRGFLTMESLFQQAFIY